jgi:hypothetical protein
MPPRAAYALFMLLALGVFVLARRVVPKPPGYLAVPTRKRVVLALAAFVGGSLGGKLPFALAEGWRAWLDGSAWLSDGKTIVAALIGAYLAVELAKWLLEVRVKTGDTFAFPLALALAFALWGLAARDALPRQRLKLYLIAYAAYRFATEFIRPEPAWGLGLTFYQWAALALGVGLALQWLADRRPAGPDGGDPAASGGRQPPVPRSSAGVAPTGAPG